MRIPVIFRVLVSIGLVLLLGSCLIDGGSSDDTGSLVIGVPSVGSSAISSGVDTLRIWLYTPGNLEFGVDGGAARLPGASDNFLEAEVSGSSGTVVIEGIPAATGYRLVIVLGETTPDAFIPIDVAQSDPFEITGGRETALSLTAAVVAEGGLETELVGEALKGVVVVDVPTATVVTASSSRVYSGTMAGGFITGGAFDSVINSVSVGQFGTFAAAFINATDGIYALFDPGSGVDVFDDIATTMEAAGIQDIVDSGAFYLSGTGETVVYYQRLGGLGGGVFSAVPTLDTWNDSGTDLEDYVEADENPVRAAATDGTSQAFIASTLGTFAVTETFFESEFDVNTILTGDDAAGLTFWGIAYPGSSQPLRITQLGYSNGVVLAGTPRGAFAFAASAVSQASGNNGLIPASAVTQINAVATQPILDISVNDGYVALATAREIVVVDGADYTAEFRKPLRAVTLGAPASIFVVDEGGVPAVYVAGAEGLTRVVE